MDSAENTTTLTLEAYISTKKGENRKRASLPKRTSAFDSCNKSGGSIFDRAALTLRELPLLESRS